VRFAGQQAAPPKESRSDGGPLIPRVPAALVVFAAIGVAGWLGKLPVPLLMLCGFMSAVAWALYRADKHAALAGEWRTPENWLHAAAVFGGWPGALLAQGMFRHKSRKASFQAAFWLTVVVNCAVVIYLLRSGIQ
jgi:uncharacterized membrane protein YsdA (DUF1294 family)